MVTLGQFLFFKCMLLLACHEHTSAQKMDPPEVTTKLGKVMGKHLSYGGRSVDAYLGVPYAKPPLGELRFKNSEPVEPWKGSIVADENPPACPQYTPAPFPWYDGKPPHKEDCLYMNIFVPTIPSKKGRTVLYWLYGGGFFIGSNKAPIYDSKALAIIGDVVVVTINYRLGPLGFFYSGTDDAPGNAGIYDMILGLKWVNENIASFGGDPKSITIFGQSAGSISVSLLSISPLAKGLYNRAILMSGSAFSLPAGNENDLNMGQALAENVGCANSSITLRKDPKQVVDCLRGVDATKLVTVLGEMNPRASRTFLPTFGDDIVGKDPQESLRSGNFHHTDILIGNVADEGSFQLTTSHPDMFGFFGEKDTKVNKSYGEMLIRKTFSRVKNPDEAVAHYLGHVNDNDEREIRKQVYTASGDFTLLCPTVYHADEFAKRKNKVYYYLFTHRPSNSPWAKWMGVVHFEEVQFIFGEPAIEPFHYKNDEVGLSERVIKLWTNFAKTGDPGESWPLYTESKQKLKIINTNDVPLVGHGPHQGNCDFLRKYYGLGKRNSTGGNGLWGSISPFIKEFIP